MKEPGKLPTFNARSETLAVKPAFRSSFKDLRCLVVVDGFYEWPKKPSRDNLPLIRYGETITKLVIGCSSHTVARQSLGLAGAVFFA